MEPKREEKSNIDLAIKIFYFMFLNGGDDENQNVNFCQVL